MGRERTSTIWLRLAALATILAGCHGKGYYGVKIGDLEPLAHAVKGEVFAVDSRTIHIRGFSYDGTAPDAFFYAGTSGQPSDRGIIIPDEKGTKNILGAYRNKHITLTLPDGQTLKDIAWFSVWCRAFAINFGHVMIPARFDYPRPQKIDAFPTFEHGVSSDRIVVVDAQTFLIPNFSYDGQAPDAHFWVGKGSGPGPTGNMVPDENGAEEPLKKYTSKTIVITLPGAQTIFDIDHLSVWCRAFFADFGHVRIPKNLNIPPSLKMLGVAPQTKLNCEVLWDDLAFEVRWAVAGESIVMQLVGRVADGQYMAFGLSGSTARSVMVGGDVIVSWLDQASGRGVASDYILNAKAQCQGGQGACPDESIRGSSGNVRLLNAALINEFTMLTFQRPLRAVDRNDLPIYTNGSQAVIWAMGPVNSQGQTSYHNLRVKGDMFLDFGRTPQWNCPLPEDQGNKRIQGGANTPPPAPKHASAWYIPPIPCYEPADGVFYAQIGPTGGKNGYNAITGHVGWGIAWFINGLLIPEIFVVRGRTYNFVIEGGQDPSIPARFHPFYITDDPEGGYEFKTPAERANHRVYAGVSRDRQGNDVPSATGRLCEWVEDPNQAADAFDSFGAYQRTLQLDCQEGQPGILQWTPDASTPDTVYYQCYTHRYLGWKITVLNECEFEQLATAGSVQHSAVAAAPDYDYYDYYYDDINPNGIPHQGNKNKNGGHNFQDDFNFPNFPDGFTPGFDSFPFDMTPTTSLGPRGPTETYTPTIKNQGNTPVPLGAPGFTFPKLPNLKKGSSVVNASAFANFPSGMIQANPAYLGFPDDIKKITTKDPENTYTESVTTKSSMKPQHSLSPSRSPIQPTSLPEVTRKYVRNPSRPTQAAKQPVATIPQKQATKQQSFRQPTRPAISTRPPQFTDNPIRPTQSAKQPIFARPSQSRPTQTVATRSSQSRPTQTVATRPSQSRPTQTVATRPSQSRPTQTVATRPSQSRPTQTVATRPSQSRPTQTVATSPSQSRPTQAVVSRPSQSRPMEYNAPTFVTIPPRKSSLVLSAQTAQQVLVTKLPSKHANTKVPNDQSSKNPYTSFLTNRPTRQPEVITANAAGLEVLPGQLVSLNRHPSSSNIRRISKPPQILQQQKPQLYDNRLSFNNDEGFDPNSVIFESDFKPIRQNDGSGPVLAFEVSSSDVHPVRVSPINPPRQLQPRDHRPHGPRTSGNIRFSQRYIDIGTGNKVQQEEVQEEMEVREAENNIDPFKEKIIDYTMDPVFRPSITASLDPPPIQKISLGVPKVPVFPPRRNSNHPPPIQKISLGVPKVPVFPPRRNSNHRTKSNPLNIFLDPIRKLSKYVPGFSRRTGNVKSQRRLGQPSPVRQAHAAARRPGIRRITGPVNLPANHLIPVPQLVGPVVMKPIRVNLPIVNGSDELMAAAAAASQPEYTEDTDIHSRYTEATGDTEPHTYTYSETSDMYSDPTIENFYLEDIYADIGAETEPQPILIAINQYDETPAPAGLLNHNPLSMEEGGNTISNITYTNSQAYAPSRSETTERTSTSSSSDNEASLAILKDVWSILSHEQPLMSHPRDDAHPRHDHDHLSRQERKKRDNSHMTSSEENRQMSFSKDNREKRLYDFFHHLNQINEVNKDALEVLKDHVKLRRDVSENSSSKGASEPAPMKPNPMPSSSTICRVQSASILISLIFIFTELLFD